MSFSGQNALLQAAITDLQASRSLTPVPASALTNLSLPDGAPLPKSLLLWLAASDTWPSGLPALVDGALPIKTMASLGASAQWTGHALILESASGQDKLLYLGSRTRGGRCAVLTREGLTREGSTFSMHAPGLAFYLAGHTALPPQTGTPLYASALTAFRELFQGRF